jgi:hypothetical protein
MGYLDLLYANTEGFLTTTNLVASLGMVISVALIFLEWQESSRSQWENFAIGGSGI